jgi:hypothetical protein
VGAADDGESGRTHLAEPQINRGHLDLLIGLLRTSGNVHATCELGAQGSGQDVHEALSLLDRRGRSPDLSPSCLFGCPNSGHRPITRASDLFMVVDVELKRWDPAIPHAGRSGRPELKRTR